MSLTIYWKCLTCDEQGTTTGTEYGDDKKHVDDTGHATLSTVKASMLVPSTQED